MRTLLLRREYHPTGTNGQLYLDGQFICHTIELPWRGNARNISCIPEGRYRLTLRWSSRWGWHFLIPSVPDRDGILFHPANDAEKELRGCIAPVTFLLGPGKGSRSRDAHRKLLEWLEPVLKAGVAVRLIIQS